MRRSIFLVSLVVSVCLLAIGSAVHAEGAENDPSTVPSTMMLHAAQQLAESVAEPGGVERLLQFSRGEALLLEMEDASRVDWSYWPRPRKGLAVGNMGPAQRQGLHTLLASVLSSTGRLKVVQIMQLEEILRSLDGAGLSRDIGNYRLAFFGQPAASDPWGWRFEGHHVSLNLTMVDGDVRITPSFLGANPAEVRQGPLTGFRTLGAEEDLGRQLVGSLSEAQRGQAILTGDPPRDILTGTLGKQPDAWDEWKTSLQPQGIRLSELGPVQKAIAKALFMEAVGTYRPELAKAQLEGIELDDLSFAWMGGIAPGEPHYYRLQAGDFVFELDNVQQNGNHIHTIWRDRRSDFGEDLLKRHYENDHH